MEAIRSSETSGTTQRTTRRHISEEDTLHGMTMFILLMYVVYITQTEVTLVSGD
jgi:hypothetical protein